MAGRPGSRPPIREVPESELLENTPLVHFTVRRMLGRGALRTDLNLEYEELVQIGMIGLWEALRRWEPGRGALSTYCSSYISGYLLHHQRTSTRASGWARSQSARGSRPAQPGHRLADVTSLQRELAENFRLIDTLPSSADTEDQAHWALEVAAVKDRILALRDPFRTFAVRHYVNGEPASVVGAAVGWNRGTAHYYSTLLRPVIIGMAEPRKDWLVANESEAEAA